MLFHLKIGAVLRRKWSFDAPAAQYLKREFPTMQKNNIRLMFIGRSDTATIVRDDMKEGVRLTAGNPGCG